MTKFITLISGKGGTGKTTTAINLAAALQKLGKESIVVDGNLATPNVALYLNMPKTRCSLNDFFRKKADVKDIITAHPAGLRFIAAPISFTEFDRLNSDNLAKLFVGLEGAADVVIVDSAAGLGKDVLSTLRHPGEALLVTNPTRAAVTDSLKMLKFAQGGDATVAGVLLNRVVGDSNELQIKSIEKLIGHPIAGVIPEDDNIRKSHHVGLPVVHKYPHSKASKAYLSLARFVGGLPPEEEKEWWAWLKGKNSASE